MVKVVVVKGEAPGYILACEQRAAATLVKPWKVEVVKPVIIPIVAASSRHQGQFAGGGQARGSASTAKSLLKTLRTHASATSTTMRDEMYEGRTKEEGVSRE